MRLNVNLMRATLTGALGGLLFGFDTVVIAGAIGALVKLYNLDPHKEGLTVAIGLVGTVIGALGAGQIGQRLVSGTSAPTPTLPQQRELVTSLYDALLSHYGLRIGLRHARKHLGWALDVAAGASRAPGETLKAWRHRVLTSEQPIDVKRELRDALDDFAWRAAA